MSFDSAREDHQIIAAVMLDIGFLPAFLALTTGEEFVGFVHRLLGTAVRAVPLLVDSRTLFSVQLERYR